MGGLKDWKQEASEIGFSCEYLWNEFSTTINISLYLLSLSTIVFNSDVLSETSKYM